MKPLYSDCPVCGKVCLIDEPHEEIQTKRKQWIYVHFFCTGRKNNDRNDKKN